jgi:hypothetical protein
MEVFTWARDWETAERRIIAAHRKAGAPLLNVARGGVDIPANRGKARGLSTPHWRKIVGHFVWAIGMVSEPYKHIYRDLLRATGRVRRAILLKFGPDALAFYDKAFHAQVVLRQPLAWRPLPGFFL